jgi:Domain of unknown function (DUF6916)
MVEKLTHENFARYVNHKCQVHHSSGSLEMELIECRKLPIPVKSEGQRQPFALLFRGPKVPALPQHTYQVEFERLDNFEIFIVPVGPDEHGMQYEAIFA